MAQTVFAPAPIPPSPPPTNGAQAVYVDRALFVLKGTYENPIKEDPATPLPPHRWALVHEKSVVFAEGTTSDAKGISAIFKPDANPLPDGEWDLLLIPIFDQASSDLVASYEEAWIDVDKNAWVAPDLVANKEPLRPGQFSTNFLRAIKEARLLRIPLWSTKRKATMGGGFLESHPDAADFTTKGTLKTAELKQHGTWDKPWEIRIDQGWLRTWVELHYYNPSDKKDKTPPRGLILQSIAAFVRLGASSVRLDDGRIYMLHCRPESGMPEKSSYAFATHLNTQLAYGTDTFISGIEPDMDRMGTHYFVPDQWGSIGMEAWIGPGEPTADKRKPFPDLRLEGKSRSAPLCFHLDDIVLIKRFEQVPTPIRKLEEMPFPEDEQRLALLDHGLAVRSPEKGENGGDLSRSTVKLVKFPMRAEECYYVKGSGFEQVTRMIEHEGTMYELTWERVKGSPEISEWVGARAARNPSSISGGFFQMYLVDVRYIPSFYNGVLIKPAHLLVHISCRLDDTGLKGSNKKALPLADEMLVASSKQWDQAHPAHPGSDSKKPYALVRRGGVASGDTVIKVRRFFSSRRANPTGNIRVLIEYEGRAHAADPMKVYLKDGLVIDPPIPSGSIPEVPRPPPYTDLEPKGDAVSDPVDGVSERWFTLAHELGHEDGLPDEYLEGIATGAIHSDATGFLPRFDQAGHAAKPFHGDEPSMMKSNKLPRLRYLWKHLEEFHAWVDGGAPDNHWSKTQAPFVAELRKGPLNMQYDLVTPGPKLANGADPWTPTNQGTHGLCKVALFRLGDDESSVGPMFLPSDHALLSKGERFDGLLLVVPLFWFSFDSSVSSALDRWDLMVNFGRDFFDNAKMPHFYIRDTGGAATFKRVAIIVQPRFEYGPNPSTRGSPPTPEVKTNATLEIEISGKPGIVLQKSSGGLDSNGQPLPSSAALQIKKDLLLRWIYRMALMANPDLPATKDDSPLVAKDFVELASWFLTTVGHSKADVVPFG